MFGWDKKLRILISVSINFENFYSIFIILIAYCLWLLEFSESQTSLNPPDPNLEINV